MRCRVRLCPTASTLRCALALGRCAVRMGAKRENSGHYSLPLCRKARVLECEGPAWRATTRGAALGPDGALARLARTVGRAYDGAAGAACGRSAVGCGGRGRWAAGDGAVAAAAALACTGRLRGARRWLRRAAAVRLRFPASSELRASRARWRWSLCRSAAAEEAWAGRRVCRLAAVDPSCCRLALLLEASFFAPLSTRRLALAGVGAASAGAGARSGACPPS